MSARARILLAVLAVIALVNVASVVYIVDREHAAALARLHDTIREDERLLSAVTAGPLHERNLKQLNAILDAVFADPDVLEIELKGARGDVALARSRQAAAQGGERLPLEIALRRGGDELGKLRVAYTTANIEQRLAESRNAVAWFALLLMLILTAVVYPLATRLTRSIGRLTRAAQRIAAGDLQRDIDPGVVPELAGLGMSFIRMRDAVREQMADLAQKNRQLNEQVEERIRVEAALRRSDERLSQAVRVAHIGIFDHDQIADTIYWSPEQRNIYGLGANEAVTLQVYLDHVYPGDVERIGAAVERAHDPAGDGSFDIEHRIVRSDGGIRWVDTRARTFFEGEGPQRHAVRTIGAVLDVTERRNIEEMRALLAAVVETSSDAIVVTSPRMDIVSWNTGAERIFGWAAAEVVGSDHSLIVPPELRGEPQHNTELLERGEVPPSFETVRLTKDGRRLDVQISLSGIYDEDGKLKLVAAIFRDITERKAADAALRQSEQRFRALVELSSDWYWQTDAEHRFTFRDGAVLQRMGIVRELDYGKRRWEMGFLNMSEADWARHRAALDRREEFRDLLLERRSPDGRVFWATVSGRPLFDEAGDFIGYHGTGREITAQVMAEQALRESEAELRRVNERLEIRVAERTAELAAANTELEAFAYSVSHDLRAPLRAIDGFSRVLLEDYGAGLDADGRGYLDRVRSAVQRMGELIDDMLQLSRVARVEMHPEGVDLSRLAAEIAAQLKAAEPQRRVEVLIGSGLSTRGDPRLLSIVLNNLLENAWKYTGKTADARIEFSATAGEREVVFCVKDNGAGFDMRYLDKLFGAFQRLHTEREFPGTGVGLATVARIIHRHGGRVWALGEPQKGASFYFALPSDARPR
jgi:PAS domain S-box-containing protein